MPFTCAGHKDELMFASVEDAFMRRAIRKITRNFDRLFTEV